MSNATFFLRSDRFIMFQEYKILWSTSVKRLYNSHNVRGLIVPTTNNMYLQYFFGNKRVWCEGLQQHTYYVTFVRKKKNTSREMIVTMAVKVCNVLYWIVRPARP